MIKTMYEIGLKDLGLKDLGGSVVGSSLLQRPWVQFPAPTWCLTITCHSGSRASDDVLWSFKGPRHTYGTHVCMQVHGYAGVHTHTHDYVFRC